MPLQTWNIQSGNGCRLSFRDLMGQIATRVLVCLLMLMGAAAFLARSAGAQAQDYLERLGRPSSGASMPVQNGSVDLSNGNLHIEIPMGSFPQRGGTSVSVRLEYDSRLWTILDGGSDAGFYPATPFNANGGWRVIVGSFFSPTPCSTQYQANCGGPGFGSDFAQCSFDGVNFHNYVFYSGFSWAAPDGTTKNFSGLWTLQTDGTSGGLCEGPDTPTASAYDDDGTGYYMSVTGYNIITVYDNRGNMVWPTTEDTNGNILGGSIRTGGASTDTLGRNLVTGTQNGNVFYFDLPNAQGGTSQFTLTNTTVNVSTAFDAPYVNEFSGTLTVVQSLQLPNGQTYTFGYDSGTTPGHYGSLTSMTLPTGAQVQFGYTPFTDVNCNENLWVTSYNSVGNVWTYTPSATTPGTFCRTGSQQLGSGQHVNVTNPDGSSSVYQFLIAQGFPASSTTTQHYDFSGSLLETELLEYPSTIPSLFPIRLTTTVPSSNGSISKKIEYSYDNDGWHNVSEVREWDWYSGSAPSTPTRITDGTYTAGISSYLAANVLNLPATIVVKNGSGTVVAQTSYTYDGASPVCTSGVTEHDYYLYPCTGSNLRGNATQVSEWLNTTNSWISSQATFDDTGNKLTTTDPNTNITTFSYADNFTDGVNHNTNAYLTQTSLQSVNGVSHSERKQFDFNTGLLTATCGENFAGSVCSRGLATPQSDYETHTYDLIGRLLTTIRGDGGQDTLTYNDTNLPVSGTSTTSIDASHNRVTTKVFDSLGRTSQTQVSGTIFSDTTYDSMGRVHSVSNPHLSTSSPTDGITTTTYDGLGRATVVTAQDGGQSTITYSGNSVTTVDPAGKQRRSFTDGLGRLTEVDEPSSNANATPGTGSSTVSGSEQNSSGTGAAPGSGTVTIGGTEAFTLVGTKPNQTKVYDAGTVSITVNGSTETVTYGESSTNSAVAAGLAATINNNHSFPVTASVSGTTITLTATTTGTSTDYSLSATSATTESNYFFRASFSATASGSALTGGSNGSGQTYDAGTVSVTVNGHTDSTTYGQGSTAAALAAALVSAINGDSSASVTASASGAAITLTAASTGANTNYSFSAGSSTNYPTIFSSPSFSISVSGSALTGGTTPNLLSSPNVTLYTYDLLDNLICVVQKGTDTTAFTNCASASATWRPRTFVYDSLSRLTSATNPESGTIIYTYDGNGNLLSKTSPAPNQTGSATVTLSFCYDGLDRIVSKAYTLQSCPMSSPVVGYFYDQSSANGLTIANGIGRRTSMSDSAGSEAWSFDAMGRVLTDSRTTNGVTMNTVFAPYTYTGGITTITYPSGRSVTYTYNATNQPVTAVDTSNNINYATNASYAPTGALSGIQNGTNIISTLYYNTRLQPCRISVSVSGTAPASCTDTTNIGNVTDYTYGFALSAADDGNVDSIANNRDATRSQNFTYDALSRVYTAGTQISTGTHAWGTQYTYDAWGNYLSSTTTQGSAPQLNVGTTLSNQIPGYCYDAAGNILDQGACQTPHTYVYDLENHMTSAAGVTYSYDGEGNRVQKSTGKLYWYGSLDSPLDETDSTGSTNNSSFSEYIFFGENRVARRDYSGNVFYYFTDHLGTAREILQAGQTSPCYDADFYPFGGEITYTSTCSENYKFTGKERDAESGLDDFIARYYGSTLGRFLSPDESLAGQDAGDPQSWNLYSYTRNNPLNAVDPDGHDCVIVGGGRVSVERGKCHGDSGGEETYVDGKVDEKSLSYNPLTQTLSFKFTPYGATSGSIAVATGEIGGVESGSGPTLTDQRLSDLRAAGDQANQNLNAVYRQELLALAGEVGGRLIGAGINGIRAAQALRAAGAATGDAAEIARILLKAAGTVGNQGIQASSKQVALAAAEDWVGPGARTILDRTSGQVAGKISADGSKIYRITSINKFQPYVNLVNTVTSGNLHVRF